MASAEVEFPQAARANAITRVEIVSINLFRVIFIVRYPRFVLSNCQKVTSCILICRDKLTQMGFLLGKGHGKEALPFVQLVDRSHFFIA